MGGLADRIECALGQVACDLGLGALWALNAVVIAILWVLW